VSCVKVKEKFCLVEFFSKQDEQNSCDNGKQFRRCWQSWNRCKVLPNHLHCLQMRRKTFFRLYWFSCNKDLWWRLWAQPYCFWHNWIRNCRGVRWIKLLSNLLCHAHRKFEVKRFPRISSMGCCAIRKWPPWFCRYKCFWVFATKSKDPDETKTFVCSDKCSLSTTSFRSEVGIAADIWVSHFSSFWQKLGPGRGRPTPSRSSTKWRKSDSRLGRREATRRRRSRGNSADIGSRSKCFRWLPRANSFLQSICNLGIDWGFLGRILRRRSNLFRSDWNDWELCWWSPKQSGSDQLRFQFLKIRMQLVLQNLAKFGKLWQNLANYGKLWQNLANYGKLWQNMAKFSQFSQFSQFLRY